MVPFFSSLFFGAAMILAFKWEPRPGKTQLCLSLLFAFIGSLMNFILLIIIVSGLERIIRQNIYFYTIYNFLSGTIHLTWVVLLLLFVIKARDYYEYEDSYEENAEA
jgi:hypothetical protein